MCKFDYLSRSVFFFSGVSSSCSGSSSITGVSFSFRFNSMLRAFSRSVFSFSSSSNANGFSTSTFAISSCAMVSAFLVFAASSRAGSLASSFSIRVKFPEHPCLNPPYIFLPRRDLNSNGRSRYHRIPRF